MNLLLQLFKKLTLPTKNPKYLSLILMFISSKNKENNLEAHFINFSSFFFSFGPVFLVTF